MPLATKSKSMAEPLLRIIASFLTLLFMSTALSAADENVATYIVHMDDSSMPSAFAAAGRRSWYRATLAGASNASRVDEMLVYVYDNVIRGFSARLSPAQLEQLKKSPGFLSCYRDVLVEKDTTHTPEFLGLSAGGGLWHAADFGEDVIIGVVDTGVWPESASYRDDGLPPVPSRWRGKCEAGTSFKASACNRKLIGARSFSKGLRAFYGANFTLSNDSPRDTNGHGTHTSSTAAGSSVSSAAYFGYAPGTARGMAPRARVAMYKALFDEGAVSSDIIAAIDKAISDGVDVVSLSLGINGVPLYEDAIAIASFAAMERGIFVSTSTGNRGPSYRFLHNGTPWVLTVGASTVDREFIASVVLGDGAVVPGQSLYAGRPPKGIMPLAFLGKCENITLLKNTRHKIVVCEVPNLESAFDNAIEAKVDACLFISGDPFAEVYLQFPFAGAVVSPREGSTILNYIRKHPEPKAKLQFRQTIIGTTPAPVVATYTSRGPAASCPTVLKPDIIAPGSLILASWAQNSSVARDGSHNLYSAFNIISGSSMSCPHAAGVAALLKAASPEWSPAAIRSALMTTANHLDNTGSPIKDMGRKNAPANPLALGSGHISPNKALDPGLIYDAGPSDYINLMCAMNFTKAQIKTITGKSTVCSNAKLDLNYPSFIAYFDANASPAGAVREFQRTVTNVGDSAATSYRAKITQIKGFTISVSPEVLVFKEKNEKQSFVLTVKEDAPAKRGLVAHSSLTWVEDMGEHAVRSPIVATTLTS